MVDHNAMLRPYLSFHHERIAATAFADNGCLQEGKYFVIATSPTNSLELMKLNSPIEWHIGEGLAARCNQQTNGSSSALCHDLKTNTNKTLQKFPCEAQVEYLRYCLES